MHYILLLLPGAVHYLLVLYSTPRHFCCRHQFCGNQIVTVEGVGPNLRHATPHSNVHKHIIAVGVEGSALEDSASLSCGATKR